MTNFLYKSLYKRFLLLFSAASIVAFVGLTGNVAMALTPDGTTPANDGVCDDLLVDGTTKGLYGLCVAYCEAQDLDSVDTKPPSLKILENYDKKKQGDDPDMPCISQDFGCFDQAELDSISTTNHCMRFSDGTGSFIQHGIQDGLNSHFIKVDTRPTASCVYVDFVTTDAGTGIVRNQYLNGATQAQIAHDAIEAKCVLLGL